MHLDTYLRRIRYDGTCVPTAQTLAQLHLAHMRSVPFENLDIPLRRPIELALPLLFDKVVARRRGGFCYELNALFAWLLREVGFRVELLSGRVLNAGTPGPEFDHMLLRVRDDADRSWIADVGFGDSFLEPLPLRQDEQVQHGRGYRLRPQGEAWVLEQREIGGEWAAQYVFSPQPRGLEEFHAMCHYQQTSPDSVFTRKAVCSMATHDGRVTLANNRLIVTSGGQRRERQIAGLTQYFALLQEHFGFDLGDEPHAERLIRPRPPP